MRPNCPRCSKEKPMKNGHAMGKRRWKCRLCGYEYTKKLLQGMPESLKKKAVVLYESGWSSNMVGQILRVSPTSVLRWARQYTWPHGRVHHLKPRIYLPLEVKNIIQSVKQSKQELKSLRALEKC